MILHDRYELQTLLGQKAGRRTWLATDLETERSVVVKLLLLDVDFDEDSLKSLEREAKTIQDLDHPAIPKYIDWFEAELQDLKGFALVQTYIPDQSLDAIVQASRTLSPQNSSQLTQCQSNQILHPKLFTFKNVEQYDTVVIVEIPIRQITLAPLKKDALVVRILITITSIISRNIIWVIILSWFVVVVRYMHPLLAIVHFLLGISAIAAKVYQDRSSYRILIITSDELTIAPHLERQNYDPSMTSFCLTPQKSSISSMPLNQIREINYKLHGKAEIIIDDQILSILGRHEETFWLVNRLSYFSNIPIKFPERCNDGRSI